jgi:glucosamine--fructose-6-phosphate aminotransferase (isomerizing)
MTNTQTLIDEINSNLRNAIYQQPQLLPNIINNLQSRIAGGLDDSVIRQLRKIFITGCGDSYFAGVAAELAFRQFAGIDTQPIEALNFSRFVSPWLQNNSALIAISNSGIVSRTIEAARRAQGKASVWAFTDNPSSPLAEASDWTLAPGIPSIPTGGTGTLSYLASLSALLLTAIEIGKKKGSLQNPGDVLAGVEDISQSIEETLKTNEEIVLLYVEGLPVETLYFVGGGPNYGSAMYGAAKVMEALSLNGIAVELEEWAHLEFHTTGPNTYYILIAPPDAAYGRALEQAQGIIESGGHLAALVDKDDDELSKIAEVVFRVEAMKEPALSPLLYCIPLQMIAVELAIARNKSMKMRLDENRKEINFRQIFQSKIVSE